MRDQNSSQGLQYQERIVAFLDILGFRDLVIRSEADQSTFQTVKSALDKIIRTSNSEASDYDYRASTFSDNIVVSAKLNAESLYYIMLSIDVLISNLLSIGILCRGGVTVGNLIHNKDMVFGKGLVSAYDLENRLAKHPRVILDSKIVELASTVSPSEWYSDLPYKVFRDFDGLYCIHYLYDFSSIDTNKEIKENPNLMIAYNIALHMNKAIKNCTDNPSAFEKYRYFSDYWRDAVDAPQLLSQTGLIPPISIPQSLLDRRHVPFKTGIK